MKNGRLIFISVAILIVAVLMSWTVLWNLERRIIETARAEATRMGDGTVSLGAVTSQVSFLGFAPYFRVEARQIRISEALFGVPVEIARATFLVPVVPMALRSENLVVEWHLPKIDIGKRPPTVLAGTLEIENGVPYRILFELPKAEGSNQSERLEGNITRKSESEIAFHMAGKDSALLSLATVFEGIRAKASANSALAILAGKLPTAPTVKNYEVEGLFWPKNHRIEIHRATATSSAGDVHLELAGSIEAGEDSRTIKAVGFLEITASLPSAGDTKFRLPMSLRGPLKKPDVDVIVPESERKKAEIAGKRLLKNLVDKAPPELQKLLKGIKF